MYGASLMFSCSDTSKRVPELNYYVEIKTNQDDSVNNELAAFLAANIPKYKYTFTYRSGQAWPYYAVLELDETISADSLMPPHWYLHKMMIREESTILKNRDHLVRIELMPKSDTILNYRVDIYQMDATALTFSATTGVHFVDSARLPANLSLPEYYLKSIIRYSFK
jgi:hypothetical protein